MQTIPLHAISETPTALSRMGAWLHRHRSLIVTIQWLVVIFYLFLVITPAFLPLPPDTARITDNLVRFAQFLFWGIWWPFVILSMLLVGRVWCGVFCPEGTLTEWVSHHSKNIRPLPRWIKWPGWPFVAFVCTTVYGQMVSVYDYAKPTLLILGGSTLGAVAIAYFYGRNRRVWCKYLCPVNGVFHLLARLSPIQLRVDKHQWRDNKNLGHQPVICAPLINIKQLNSMSECHQCFRCHGYREAVTLQWRSPNAEITQPNHTLTTWHQVLIVFGVFGLASGAFQWSSNPLVIEFKQVLAQAVVQHDWVWLLNNSAWWIFTNYPQNNDVFNWLDGFVLLSYLALSAMVIGGSLWVALYVAANILKKQNALLTWGYLSESLTPLAAVLLFLGLSMTTVNLLRLEGIHLHYVAHIRAVFLLIGIMWSINLFIRQTRSLWLIRRLMAAAIILVGSLPLLTSWFLLFFSKLIFD